MVAYYLERPNAPAWAASADRRRPGALLPCCRGEVRQVPLSRQQWLKTAGRLAKTLDRTRGSYDTDMKPYLSINTAPALFLFVAGFVSLPANAQNTAPAATAQPDIDLHKLLAGPNVSEEQQAARRDLENVLEAAREPLDQATAHAALANWLLAVPTARPATRWVLGLDRSEDRRILAESAADARTHLSTAERLLKEGDADSSSEKARRRRLSADVNTLKGFAEVFAAAGASTEADDRREVWAEAASALSEARESDNPQVGSAAILWQAMAWMQAGRAERAMKVLPEALLKPDTRYDFLSRVLRCRMLLLQGQPSAALALTTQMRARVDDWFPRERTSRQRARARLIGVVQLQVGQEWRKTLAAGTRPADAEILDEILAKVRKDLFPQEDTDAEVYVLEEAVPILVKPPAVKPLSTAPATQPE